MNSHEAPLLAVVGVGALGSEVCRVLALTGGMRIVLIDPDRIEAKNLAYSEMIRLGYKAALITGEVEPYKTTVVMKTAESIFGQSGWIERPMEIADVECSILAECALIFSCTDSLLARCETSWIARLLNKGIVDGGLKAEGEQQGRVSWFPARTESACYLCQISDAGRAEILQYAMAPSLGCMAQPLPAPMDASTSIISLIARQIVSTGMRILEGRFTGNGAQVTDNEQSHAWRYEITESGIRCDEILLARSSTCPWHEIAGTERFVSAQPEEKISALLQKTAARDILQRKMVFELQWPLCLRARCTVCGREQQTAMRLGLMRKRGMCAVCGASSCLDAIEVVRTIGEDSIYAKNRLQDLGFRTEQIFRIRPEFY